MNRIVSVVAVLGVLVACGNGGDRTVTTAPDGRPSAVPKRNVLQVPDRRIENPRPTAVDRVDYEDDRSKLRVTYWGGVEDCYGLHHVSQHWEPGVVVLTVFTGSKRLPANTVCIEIAVTHATIVSLDQDIGGRTVIDGSTGDPVKWR